MLSSISKSFSTLRDGALTILYPQSCSLCDGIVESWRDGVACTKCWESINRTFDLCDKCGAFISTHRSSTQNHPTSLIYCGKCNDLEFVLARS
ncbi:MAG TPA: double zinc ribbon domain-containing protein, partial [Blastocatellia bacterium]|nr:double zinc ribbon domain-containing protein [Blastocatellia bacterium]